MDRGRRQRCAFCGVVSRGAYCGVVCRIMAHCAGTSDPGACWIWVGARRKNGYGLMRVRLDGRWVVRNPWRVMYAAHYGEVPPAGHVRNACGSKNCCNPKHLVIGVSSLALAGEQLLRGDGDADRLETGR